MRKVKWKVSLSNGRTFYEGKGNFVILENELSPWNRLKNYMKDNDVEITSASLYTDDGRNFHVPSLGENPKFPFFDQVEKPKSYNFFNAVTSNRMGVSKNRHYVVIEALYDDYRLQMWVDENHTENCWCLCMKK